MRRVASELCMISINLSFPLSAPYERSINLKIEIDENVFTADFAVHRVFHLTEQCVPTQGHVDSLLTAHS